MISKGLFTSNKLDWETPSWLFELLDDHFNFECDVCADDRNYLVKNYFTKENSCLNKEWYNMNFMNPPYGRKLPPFVEKAYNESKDYGPLSKMTVALLPARTDTKWFHDYIYNKAEIIFIKGRLKFGGDSKNIKGAAPFPSMIVIWFNYNFIKFKRYNLHRLEEEINSIRRK